MLTAIDHFKTLINRHQNKFVLVVSAVWLSLFLPIWNFLGQHRGSVNSIFLLLIFPILGILSLLAALMGRKFSLFIFGLLLVFAFPLTMAMGYALLGP